MIAWSCKQALESFIGDQEALRAWITTAESPSLRKLNQHYLVETYHGSEQVYNEEELQESGNGVRMTHTTGEPLTEMDRVLETHSKVAFNADVLVFRYNAWILRSPICSR